MTEPFEIWIVQYIPHGYDNFWVDSEAFLSRGEAEEHLLTFGDREKRIVYVYAGGTVLDD